MSVNTVVESEEKDAKLLEIIDKYRDTKGALIPVLHEVQGLYGYLPEHAQQEISKGLGLSMSEIYGVITFYNNFHLEPKGKHQISVCLGTACYVKGAAAIVDKLKEVLEIEVGETTEDGEFTLDETRCLGACGLAPVMTINEEMYGKISKDDIPKIIKNIKNASKEA